PPLPGRPGNDFVGDVAYTLGPVRVRYGVDYVGTLFTDSAGQNQVPARLLQSAGARLVVPWVPTVRLAFDMSNLFDVRTGVPPPLPNQLQNLPPQVSPTGGQLDYP